MSYRIFVESSADLSKAQLAEYNISCIEMEFMHEDKAYTQNDVSIKEFYDMMRDGAHMTTSAANVSSYITKFATALEAGEDVLLLSFSSGLSCSYNNALLAAEELSEKYPERKIVVVDTLCASLGHGLIAYLTAKKRDEGASITEAASYAEELIPKLCHSFTVETLKYLHRGGRVSTATAVAGSVLGIKPVMFMNNEGKLIACGKVRGRKASLEALADKLKTHAIDSKNQTVFISQADCMDDAKVLEKMIKPYVKEVVIGNIGPLIGSHAGPGTVALFFVGDERV